MSVPPGAAEATRTAKLGSSPGRPERRRKTTRRAQPHEAPEGTGGPSWQAECGNTLVATADISTGLSRWRVAGKSQHLPIYQNLNIYCNAPRICFWTTAKAQLELRVEQKSSTRTHTQSGGTPQAAGPQLWLPGERLGGREGGSPERGQADAGAGENSGARRGG